jgi:hypothetical protein
MKNCIVNTGDVLIFQFEINMRDRQGRPMTAEEIMKLPRAYLQTMSPDVLRRLLTPEQLRQVRPDLAPPDDAPPPAAAG